MVQQIPALFPEGSPQGTTTPLPVIWDRKADFDTLASKLEQDEGGSGEITDQANVQAAAQRVGQNCGGCRETYRRKES